MSIGFCSMEVHPAIHDSELIPIIFIKLTQILLEFYFLYEKTINYMQNITVYKYLLYILDVIKEKTK